MRWAVIVLPLLILLAGVAVLELLAPALPDWLQWLAEPPEVLVNLGVAWILVTAAIRTLFRL
jgi:uncharacterized protein involved in cysteine biosynthesis